MFWSLGLESVFQLDASDSIQPDQPADRLPLSFMGSDLSGYTASENHSYVVK